MNVLLPHRVEDWREALRQARRGDPTERLALAHAQPSGAEVEHGRAGELQMQPSVLDLHEHHDGARDEHALLAPRRGQGGEELLVRESLLDHESLYHSIFQGPDSPRVASFEGRIVFEGPPIVRTAHRSTSRAHDGDREALRVIAVASVQKPVKRYVRSPATFSGECRQAVHSPFKTGDVFCVGVGVETLLCRRGEAARSRGTLAHRRARASAMRDARCAM